MQESASFAAGKSLIWFGKPAVLFGIYGPTALAGLLLPYLAFWKGKPGLKSRLLGHSLIFSVIAALLTQINGRSGFMFAAWGICSLLASSVVPEQVEALFSFKHFSSIILHLPLHSWGVGILV